jgi:A/G-specific adenine glycosylase
VRRLDLAGERTHVWLSNDKLANAALPAPVKKLLLALFGEADLLSV